MSHVGAGYDMLLSFACHRRKARVTLFSVVKAVEYLYFLQFCIICKMGIFSLRGRTNLSQIKAPDHIECSCKNNLSLFTLPIVLLASNYLLMQTQPLKPGGCAKFLSLEILSIPQPSNHLTSCGSLEMKNDLCHTRKSQH